MHELATIPDGRAGLDAKARKIRELVEVAKRDPGFRARALSIVADVPERDQEGEVRAVFDFVRDSIRYVRDPWSPGGLELFTEPRAMLDDIDAGTAAGDCDDHVILASALLEAIGYRTRFRIGGLPPDHYRHIWLEVSMRGAWVPLELVKKDEPLGYDPSHRFPLTLTLDGTGMNYNGGLGAFPSRSASSSPRPPAGVPLSSWMNDEMERKRQVIQASLARTGDSRAKQRQRLTNMRMPSDTFVARARRYKAVPALLGDYELPPSMQNMESDPTFFGFTPSDVWRNDELADHALGLEGLGGKLRKLKTRVKGQVDKARDRLKKNAKRDWTNVRKFREGLKKTVGGALQSVANKFAGNQGTGTVATDPGATGLMPQPMMPTGDYGGGDGGGGGSYDGMEPMENMDAMAQDDPFTGFDATTESEEVDSLYTPPSAAEIGPDAPMPGAGEGSFIPTPFWPPTANPFSEPASGAAGMDYSAMDVADPVSVYGETESPSYLGDWMDSLATQVLGPAAKAVIQYQQVRQAAKLGVPLSALQTNVPALPTTPVPSVPAGGSEAMQEPQQVSAPPRAAMSFGKWGPWVLGGIGALMIFGLAMSRRRR